MFISKEHYQFMRDTLREKNESIDNLIRISGEAIANIERLLEECKKLENDNRVLNEINRQLRDELTECQVMMPMRKHQDGDEQCEEAE